MFCHFHGVILSGCCVYSFAFYKRLFHSHYIVIKGNFLCVDSVCSAKSPTCINLAILSSFSWEITHLNGITMFVDIFSSPLLSSPMHFFYSFSYRLFSYSPLFFFYHVSFFSCSPCPSVIPLHAPFCPFLRSPHCFLLSFNPRELPLIPLAPSCFSVLSVHFPCSLFSFGMFYHGIYSHSENNFRARKRRSSMWM